MRSILKLTLANIRSGKGAFKSMILLMMLLTFSFSGTVSNDDRLREVRTERFAEAGVPDLLVWIYDDLLTADMLQEVQDNPNVRSVQTKQSLFFVHAPLADDKETDVRLTLNAYESGIRVFDDEFRDYAADNSLSDSEILLPSKMRLNGALKRAQRSRCKQTGAMTNRLRSKDFMRMSSAEP